MEVIILVGVQASGKSAFFKQRFSDTHVRLNLDMLRTRRREHLLFQACLQGGTSCVIDNTNISIEQRSRYIEAGRAAGARVVGYYFSSSVAECLRRNALREGKARIPDKGLLATYNRLEIPGKSEGFDQLFFVRTGSGSEISSNSSCARDVKHDFIVEDWKDEVY